MTPARRRVARIVIGIGILAVVVASVSPMAIGQRLFQADLRLVVGAVLGLTAIHLIPAAGWRAILGTSAGLWLPWPTTLAVYYTAQAFGGVTPANLGGDMHRAGVLRSSGHGWAVAVAPLIVQRATSYLALSALTLLGLAALATRTGVAAAFVVAGAACAAVVAVASWLLLAPPGPFRGAHARLVRVVGGTSASDGGRAPRLGSAPLIGSLTGLAFHAGSIGFTWLLVAAIDPAAPTGPVLAALTVARLSLAFPLAPSGLGVQEGALAVLFAALGLAAELAIAAMLLARLALLLTTVIGVALLQRARPAVPAARAGGTLTGAAATGQGRGASVRG